MNFFTLIFWLRYWFIGFFRFSIFSPAKKLPTYIFLGSILDSNFGNRAHFHCYKKIR